MIKTTRKEIEKLSKMPWVVDLSHLSGNEIIEQTTPDKNYILELAESVGKYGKNGVLLFGLKTARLFSILYPLNYLKSRYNGAVPWNK